MLNSNDVVLVTGGGSGLGAETVRSVVNRGARAVIVDLPNSPTAAQLAAELGDQVRFAPADVRDAASLEAAVASAAELGTLRAAVCCAGVVNPSKIISKRGLLSLDDYRLVIEINLVGTFNTLRLAAHTMSTNEPVADQRGVVIMTASVAAYEGQIGQAAYSSSKGGVVALTLPAAREFAAYGIRVMTIAPGVVDTPMMASLPEAARTALAANVPFPARLAQPGEYALLVNQILDNPYLNGEVIRLDGAARLPPR